MNKAATAFACLLAIVVIGCSSVARTAGQTVVIRGAVRYPDGTGAPGAVVRVKGVYTTFVFGYPLIPNSVKLLQEERCDGTGTFFCRVPVYDEYYLEVGEFPKPQSGYAIVPRTAVKDTVIIEISRGTP